MKAILREWGNESYVVRDVTLNESGAYICDNKEVYESNILTFVNEGKEDFVTCSNCGEMIPNNQKAIKEHINRKTSHKGCLTCDFLRHHNQANKTTKYTQNEDGTFHAVTSEDIVLKCGVVYYNQPDITSDKRLVYCKYKDCTMEHINTGNGFFSKYPNAFDDMITVDVLNFKHIYKNSKLTHMQLKCRGIIEACANGKGIVDCFYIRTRNDYRTVYYSNKYNKLFYIHNGKYCEFEPNYYWTRDKIDYIKKTIANLYG